MKPGTCNASLSGALVRATALPTDDESKLPVSVIVTSSPDVIPNRSIAGKVAFKLQGRS